VFPRGPWPQRAGLALAFSGGGAYLGLLGGLDDDAVARVVELPGNDAEELRLVLVAVVIRGADADELRAETFRNNTSCKFIIKMSYNFSLIFISLVIICPETTNGNCGN